MGMGFRYRRAIVSTFTTVHVKHFNSPNRSVIITSVRWQVPTSRAGAFANDLRVIRFAW